MSKGKRSSRRKPRMTTTSVGHRVRNFNVSPKKCTDVTETSLFSLFVGCGWMHARTHHQTRSNDTQKQPNSLAAHLGFHTVVALHCTALHYTTLLRYQSSNMDMDLLECVTLSYASNYLLLTHQWEDEMLSLSSSSSSLSFATAPASSLGPRVA